jgi:hypothetical protein
MKVSILTKLALLLGLSLVVISPIHATCHAVGPTSSGTGSGTDWNNRMTISTSPIRGDRYYFSDGSYGSYTSSSVSGTTTVEFRKAQSYDFGRASDGCSNAISAGWNAATMGASQASFTNVDISTSNMIWNGNGQQASPGCGGTVPVSATVANVQAHPSNPKDCGFFFDNLSSGATFANPIRAPNVTYEYVEGRGNGNADTEQIFFWPLSSGSETFTHNYLHNAGCVFIQDNLDSSVTSFNYFWGNEINQGTGSCHGQGYFDTQNNETLHDNVWRDILGTSVYTMAGGAATVTGWKIYNEVIFDSSPTASWPAPFLSDGVFACINTGVVCNNFMFMQNTIINCSAGSTPANGCGFNNQNGGTITIENNLWYSCPSVGFGGGGITENHNSFLNCGTGNSGTADVTISSGAPNPFVSWPTNYDLHLSSDNANWNNRLALSSPYTTDPDGTTRTTDRGAYQFVNSSIQPPTNLTATPGGN